MRNFGEIKTVNGRTAWPFAEMEKGDVFVVRRDCADEKKLLSLQHLVRTRHHKDFEVATLGDYSLVRVKELMLYANMYGEKLNG